MLQYDWGSNNNNSSSSNNNNNANSVVQIMDEGGSYELPDPSLTIYHHHDPFNPHGTAHHFNPETTHFISPGVDPFHGGHSNNHHFASSTAMYDASSHRMYDARGDGSYPPLTLEPTTGGFIKPEPVAAAGLEWGIGSSSASRLGLNLGGRTFYAEDDFVNRLYRRSRMLEPGSVAAPRCQAEGCNADLSHAKHYHRRHKVCEFHSKASTVIANGLTQRFCQQCSRFHLLPEFDNGKRSCRKRLADHNRRRRKSQQQPPPPPNSQQEVTAGKKSSQLDSNNNNAAHSSSENATRSPQDSRVHSSSVTIAISPPRFSVECFGHGSYGASASNSSTSSLFYSNG